MRSADAIDHMPRAACYMPAGIGMHYRTSTRLICGKITTRINTRIIIAT